ncbi:SusC/RagA family TonB-linked outer membrane protein [Aurantibacter aestuarii]|uniref:SusC/RagA family TonB-linked outer membrane protein n=1 Tax=Aurantibacter aestuarii TaxID=1266046 RepID=A0A2T1NDX7_9FLAO|nr:SusC/RagA family TonB-linked outer membrane protein [Aurantibacter aestuarii]PSG90652.1 SusC/RagA family TonB-linked outer membrane protein [Aurantibacter aestuarii]
MKVFIQKLYLILCLVPTIFMAQSIVTGNVSEKASGLPLPGVNIIIKNSSTGTSADFDGNYSLQVNPGDVIVFSYVGFVTQEIPYTNQKTINVALAEDSAQLDEVVIIGYGSVKKEDLTGSVDLVTSKDFNKGNIVSTDQLLQGKAAGVRITNDGGSPDSNPNIRIRGSASLNASNSPLIVIDGVPLGNQNPAGNSNPLSLVNPNDVESFTILKDASATAIYGARASNGVIIITTKRGTSGAPKYNFSTDTTVNTGGNDLDIMDSATYVQFINQYFPTKAELLGVPVGSVQTSEEIAQIISTPSGERAIYDTDWRENILRTAITSNTNFGVNAFLFDKLPTRMSVGYTNAKGIVIEDDYERFTGSLNMSPKFLDNNLKVNLNSKVVYAEKNAIDAGGILGNAIGFNPTQPIYNNAPDNRFGGYFQNTIVEGNNLITDGQINPLSLAEQRERPETVKRFLGNIELDYTLPFFPDLKIVTNIGLDASKSRIEERYSDNAVQTYRFDQNNSDIDTNFVFNPGTNYREFQTITNTTFDLYTQYRKEFETGFLNNFDVQIGYSYQNFKNDGNRQIFNYNVDTGIREETINPDNPNNRYFNEYNLQSFFARSNVNLNNKYLLTFSLRADASSLFVSDDIWDSDVWGFFPAAALAWKVNEEPFLKNSSTVNDLKLRLGIGQTGQNDITGAVGFYPSTPFFQAGNANSQYFPNSSLYAALPFNPDLTWEKTTTYNAGLDFSFFKNGFINGAFDIYQRETTDLLAKAPVPAGQGLTNEFIDNIGSSESKGFELNLNLRPVVTEHVELSFNGNIGYNKTEITDLEGADLLEAGGNVRGTGTTLLYHKVGLQAGSAWVLKQVYDVAGNPIPGAFADLNGDNVIDNDDRYFEQIAPNWTYGFGMNFTYKTWDLSSSFRGQVGGHVYNQTKLNYGFTESAIPQNASSLTNVLNFYTGAANPAFTDYSNQNVVYSDFFLEDATFLRCDNITLGKRFDNMIKNGSVRFYAAVSNAFIITDYTGQDPENFGGIDGAFYPRPRSFTFGLNLDF